jgi:hypothetical protein
MGEMKLGSLVKADLIELACDPPGAEAHLIFQQLTARLKSCLFKAAAHFSTLKQLRLRLFKTEALSEIG